jgi:hypothetical protein
VCGKLTTYMHTTDTTILLRVQRPRKVLKERLLLVVELVALVLSGERTETRLVRRFKSLQPLVAVAHAESSQPPRVLARYACLREAPEVELLHGDVVVAHGYEANLLRRGPARLQPMVLHHGEHLPHAPDGLVVLLQLGEHRARVKVALGHVCPLLSLQVRAHRLVYALQRGVKLPPAVVEVGV